MTTTDQVSYATRRKLQEAGVPFDLIWDSQGLYLAHWFEHRMAGKGTSVGDACKAAGFSPDAVRQRRRYSPEFKAAEQYVRTGEPYVDPASVVEEPQDVVPADPTVTDTTFRRPPAPIVEVDHGRPVGPDEPTITTIATPPASPRKRKPTRRYTPAWVSGSGYERY